MFTRQLNDDNKHSKVLTYTNIRLIQLYFSLRKNIINYKDINLISFFNYGIMYFVISVYSDNQQSALKYLKGTKASLNNILIMIGEFNIRDNNLDPLYPHHSIYVDTLREISDSFNLELSIPIAQVSTQYTDNSQDSNLVLDHVFL